MPRVVPRDNNSTTRPVDRRWLFRFARPDGAPGWLWPPKPSVAMPQQPDR